MRSKLYWLLLAYTPAVWARAPYTVPDFQLRCVAGVATYPCTAGHCVPAPFKYKRYPPRKLNDQGEIQVSLGLLKSGSYELTQAVVAHAKDWTLPDGTVQKDRSVNPSIREKGGAYATSSGVESSLVRTVFPPKDGAQTAAELICGFQPAPAS